MDFNIAIEEIEREVKRAGLGVTFWPSELYRWAGARWLTVKDKRYFASTEDMDEKCWHEFKTVVMPFFDALNEQLVLEHSLILRFKRGIIHADTPGWFEVEIITKGGVDSVGGKTIQ